jgi:hypothetical protein
MQIACICEPFVCAVGLAVRGGWRLRLMRPVVIAGGFLTIAIENSFTADAFWSNSTLMQHVVMISSRLAMTRPGGPVEDVAH